MQLIQSRRHFIRGSWLISIAGLGFGFAHRFLYYADTMGKGFEFESESVETCSA